MTSNPHFRIINGQTVYIASPAASEGEEAGVRERTAIGKFKNGSHYLRAANGEDSRLIVKASQELGIPLQKRRAGASHFGRIGAYDHFHASSAEDVAKVYGVLEGREALKGHVKGHVRNVHGRLVQVKEHDVTRKASEHAEIAAKQKVLFGKPRQMAEHAHLVSKAAEAGEMSHAHAAEHHRALAEKWENHQRTDPDYKAGRFLDENKSVDAMVHHHRAAESKHVEAYSKEVGEDNPVKYAHALHKRAVDAYEDSPEGSASATKKAGKYAEIQSAGADQASEDAFKKGTASDHAGAALSHEIASQGHRDLITANQETGHHLQARIHRHLSDSHAEMAQVHRDHAQAAHNEVAPDKGAKPEEWPDKGEDSGQPSGDEHGNDPLDKGAKPEEDPLAHEEARQRASAASHKATNTPASYNERADLHRAAAEAHSKASKTALAHKVGMDEGKGASATHATQAKWHLGEAKKYDAAHSRSIQKALDEEEGGRTLQKALIEKHIAHIEGQKARVGGDKVALDALEIRKQNLLDQLK